MKPLSFDLEYLCQKMSDLSGLPIRIFENGQLKKAMSLTPLSYDPFLLHEDELSRFTDHVAYYVTEDGDCYGIMNTGKYRLILGPSFQNPLSGQRLHDLAFALGVPAKDYEEFCDSLKAIVQFPLNSMIQMMCTLNHVFHGEILNLSDFQQEEDPRKYLYHNEGESQTSDVYKGYLIEQKVAEIVSSGNVELFKEWIHDAPSVRGGTLARGLLRQHRNTFIVSATLISRAAIHAGMKVEDAFHLSDSFIQQCENAQSVEEINALSYRTVYRFTEEVGKLKEMQDTLGIKKEVYYYVVHHLSDAIKTEDVANSLYLSRTHLSSVFKKNYGEDLNHFIHRVKMEKAAELLRDTDRGISQISDYLGYSSPSHFDRVFRSFHTISPKQYRKKETV